jgi:hypothetical protein
MLYAHHLCVRIGIGVITADLPQSNKLVSIKRHNAERGCRGCYVSKSDLGTMLKLLHSKDTYVAREKYASTWGLALGPPCV